MIQADHLSLRQRLALELWRRHEANVRAERPLRQLFWECTLRCNLSCRHCGSDCRAVAQQRDMPAEDFLHVLDGIASRQAPHQVFVVISGGEPLMRSDLEQVCSQIYHRGFPWGMVTNALALTPRRFRSLVAAGMHSVTVSIDGLSDEHNWMRGNPRSFAMVDQALSMLVATPHITFDVVTCVNRRNLSQLSSLKQYLVGKGVRRWRLFTVFPVGRAATAPDMRLAPAELRSMMEFIRSSRKEGVIRVDYGCEGFLGGYEGEVRNRFFSCQAGITVGSVLADGSISACTSIRSNYHQGNIYTDDFMDVWQNAFQPYRDRQWMRRGQCASCRYFRYCQGNGMHLRDDDGHLLFCILEQLKTVKD